MTATQAGPALQTVNFRSSMSHTDENTLVYGLADDTDDEGKMTLD